MPIFEYSCSSCGHSWERFTHKRDELPPCENCGAPTQKIHTGNVNVVPDTIPGGLMVENMSATPIRVDSKSEFKLELAKRNMTSSGVDGLGSSRFRHVGDQGSDKAKKLFDPVKGRFVTRSTNWASGPPPGVDPRPSCMLSPDEQAARRAEWLASEPAAPVLEYVDPRSDEEKASGDGSTLDVTRVELFESFSGSR